MISLIINSFSLSLSRPFVITKEYLWTLIANGLGHFSKFHDPEIKHKNKIKPGPNILSHISTKIS